jgi:hypothetical protein
MKQRLSCDFDLTSAVQGASVLFRCWRCGLLLLLLISICVCTHDMMLSLLLLALGIASAADALPETSNYNAGVTSNDDWDGFQAGRSAQLLLSRRHRRRARAVRVGGGLIA